MTTLTARLPGDGLALSNAVEAFEGARVAVLHAPGLFRLDVVIVPDNVRVIVRNLSSGALAFDSEGYPRPVILLDDELETLQLRPGHHQLTFTLGEQDDAVDVRVVLATLRVLRARHRAGDRPGDRGPGGLMRELALRVPAAAVEAVLDDLLAIAPHGVHEVARGATSSCACAATTSSCRRRRRRRGRRRAWGGSLRQRDVPDDWPARRASPTTSRSSSTGGWPCAPLWAPAPADGLIDVVLEHRRVFGSGGHPTTRACLEALCALEPVGLVRGPRLRRRPARDRRRQARLGARRGRRQSRTMPCRRCAPTPRATRS